MSLNYLAGQITAAKIRHNEPTVMQGFLLDSSPLNIKWPKYIALGPWLSLGCLIGFHFPVLGKIVFMKTPPEIF